MDKKKTAELLSTFNRLSNEFIADADFGTPDQIQSLVEQLGFPYGTAPMSIVGGLIGVTVGTIVGDLKLLPYDGFLEILDRVCAQRLSDEESDDEEDLTFVVERIFPAETVRCIHRPSVDLANTLLTALDASITMLRNIHREVDEIPEGQVIVDARNMIMFLARGMYRAMPGIIAAAS